MRRDVRVDTSGNAAAAAFVESSLIARWWLEPSAKEADAAFAGMIESVVSGKVPPSGAIAEAAEALRVLFPQP